MVTGFDDFTAWGVLLGGDFQLFIELRELLRGSFNSDLLFQHCFLDNYRWDIARLDHGARFRL